MSERQVFRFLYLAWLVVAGMLWFAVSGRHPYLFYTQLRWICWTAFIFSAFVFIHSAVHYHRVYRSDPRSAKPPVTFQLVIAALFAAWAILFNPLIPFHFRRQTWGMLDVLCLGFIALLVLICWSYLELPDIFRRWFKWLAWLIVTGWVTYCTALEVIHLYGKYALATASTTATVYEMHEEEFDSETGPSGVKYWGAYKFPVDGKTYYGWTDRYDVGDKLMVRYNPANPDDNRDSTEGFLAAETESLIGYIVFGAALYCWLKWILKSEKTLPTGKPINWREVKFGNDEAQYGACLIRSRIRDYRSWSDRMVLKHGESVRENLSSIYSEAETRAAAVDAMEQESRELLGPSVWKPLENAAWSSDAVREHEMLPLRVAYNDLSTWHPERLKFVVEGIAVLSVNVILAEMKPLPEKIRDQCRNVTTQPQAVKAADEVESVLLSLGSNDPATSHEVFWATRAAANQMSWATVEASWGAIRAAWTLSELASAAAKAADVASKWGADPDDILHKVCHIWIEAARTWHRSETMLLAHGP